MTPHRIPSRPELVLDRSRKVLIGVGAATALVSFVLFRRFPAGPGSTGGLPWLAAAGILGVMAVAFTRRWLSDLLVLAMGSCAILAIYPTFGPINPGVLIASSAVVVLWGGLVLPTIGAWALALLAFGSPWWFGVEFTFGTEPIAPGRVAFALHLVAIVLPLGLSLIVRRQQREYAAVLMERFAALSEREFQLSAQIEQQAEELDLSELKLAQAQKLETVGTMASGLAHELNNLLTPIRGMAELVASDAEDSASRRYGRRILDAAESAASITGALLTYARKGSFSPVRTNLKTLIEGQVLSVLTQSIPEAVQLRTELEDDLSSDVDRVLLQQCLTNLVFNAIDAMPKGGELVLRLFADETPRTMTDSTSDRGVAVIEVRDAGEGIDDETLEHIFDPFFTTKATGTGTGLGLAMVQGCVVRHNGEIEVETKPGEGTTFRLRFPLSRTQVPSRPWPVLGGRKDRPVVVVASKDEDTRDELEEMLSDLSCTPIETDDFATIRNMLAEVGERVDLLIVDNRDDQETHRAFVRDARALLPDLPITILTDGHRDPGLDRLLGPGPVRFVRAPVDDIVLGTLLSELLRPAGFELPYWALPAGGSRNAMHTVEFFEQQRAAIDAWGDDEGPPDSVAGE